MNHSPPLLGLTNQLSQGDQDSGSGLVLIFSASDKELDNGTLFEFSCGDSNTPLRGLMFELLN